MGGLVGRMGEVANVRSAGLEPIKRKIGKSYQAQGRKGEEHAFSSLIHPKGPYCRASRTFALTPGHGGHDGILQSERFSMSCTRRGRLSAGQEKLSSTEQRG